MQARKVVRLVCRVRGLGLLLAVSALPGGCKLGDDGEDRPLPTQGVPLPSDQAPVAEAPTRTTPRPKAEPTPLPKSESEPAAPTPQPAPKPDATTTKPQPVAADAGPAPAPAPSDAGAAPAVPTAPSADKAAQCASKCQGALEGCLKPVIPTDGGMPQLPDTERCRQAFESCRAACQ